MINISNSIFIDIEKSKCNYFNTLDDAKFVISYWYGQLKATRRFQDKVNPLFYVEAYDMFIRAMIVSGVEKKTVLPYILDYLQTIEALVEKNFHNENLINIFFFDAILLSYSSGLKKANKNFKNLCSNVLSNVRKSNSFEITQIEFFLLLCESFFKDEVVHFDYEDSLIDNLLTSILENKESNFKKEISKMRNEIINTLEEKYTNSTYFLERTYGFHNHSTNMILDGYLYFFKDFNS